MPIAPLPRNGKVAAGRKNTTMGGKADRAKGRFKEAAGVLIDDKHLEREGKLDRAAGNIKEKAEEVVDNVKGKTEEAVDKVKSTVKRKR